MYVHVCTHSMKKIGCTLPCKLTPKTVWRGKSYHTQNSCSLWVDYDKNVTRCGFLCVVDRVFALIRLVRIYTMRLNLVISMHGYFDRGYITRWLPAAGWRGGGSGSGSFARRTYKFDGCVKRSCLHRHSHAFARDPE